MSEFGFIFRERNRPVDQMRVSTLWIIEADNFPHIQCGHQGQVPSLEGNKSNVETTRYQYRDLTQPPISRWLGYHTADALNFFCE